MSKDKKLIPELRFPEFEKDGEWEVFKLGEVLLKNSTKNKKLKYSLVQSVSNKHGFINQDEYFENRIIASKDTSNYYVIKKGYFAYNPSRIDVGSLAYKHDNETSIISPLYVSFRANNEKVLDLFLLNWFSSENFKKQMIFEGGVRNTLNYENLSEIKIILPSIKEQQKIASFLSNIDEVIEAEIQKLDLLKDHKKGLMQNLFPQEGEKVPKYRFKEFRIDGEWLVKKLSDFISSLDAGVSVNSGDGPSEKNEIGILKTSCTKDGFFDYSENKVVTEGEEIKRVRESVKSDTIIISRMNTPALVGANAFVDRDYPNIFLPDRLWAAKSNRNGNMKFISYILSSDKGRFMLAELGTGTSGSMKNITKSDVLGLSILVPSLLEQEKISSTLSSLDNLIVAQVQKIEQIKKYKKGLMQVLLPKIEN